MKKNYMELIHAGALILTGVLLILFVAGVPGLGPIILVLALALVLMGIVKTNYHQKMLEQFKK